ncbi:hypothetical protein [Croceivirga sp. JEA036]|uniref:hypothetical protein n=1 Tax=Croceivirga sp. JEA036 TaxID=2721162 RepID=UPI00143C2C04|nr:hypothetical protein [Croceivirga sp. JEA036]NJB37950.1 hypothetical protein [Croceivirga sp. JEA036]
MKKDKDKSHQLPEGYFEQFNQRLMDRIAAEDAITHETLIPKTDGFSVPKGYWDTVYVNTAKAVELNTAPKIIAINSYKKWLAVAASLALLITLYFSTQPKTNKELVNFDGLAATEIQEYLQANTDELTSYELASLLPTEALGNTLFVDESLESDAILEYLDENVDELEDLNLDYELFK